MAIKMGRMYVILPDDLEEQFRKEVFNRFGMKKGNITIAIEEAIRNWIDKGSDKKDE